MGLFVGGSLLRWWMWEQRGSDWPLRTYTLLGYFGWFGLGMALAVLAAGAAAGVKPPRWIRDLASLPALSFGLAAGVAWLTTLVPLPIQGYPQNPREQLIIFVGNGLAGGFCLLPLVIGDQTAGPVRQALASAPARWLGQISYGLYLWHTPILSVVNEWVAEDRVPALGARAPGDRGHDQPGRGPRQLGGGRAAGAGAGQPDREPVTATDTAPAPAPDAEPEPSPRRAGLVDRVIATGQRPVALVGLFAVLAAVAVTTSAPGRYVGENRVDQYLAPGHRLVRTLWLWDPTRGLGRPREDLWPLQIGPLAALRGLGVSEVAAQRIFHGVLLVVAAAGAAAVLRHVRSGGDPTLHRRSRR